MSEQQAIPKLRISVSRNNGSSERTGWRWSITFKAPDARGQRVLGYRASGVISADLTEMVFERGPEVHDEKLPRWTPMNATDRPDIRHKIAQLASNAAKKLKDRGEETFECVFP